MTLGFLVRDTCSQELSTGYPKCGILATDWAALRHSPSPLRAAVAAAVDGARSRNRTGMPLRARDFKSLVSTYFTIRAAVMLLLSLHAAIMSGQSYWIRTSGLQLRRLLLYPTELRTAAVLLYLVGPP